MSNRESRDDLGALWSNVADCSLFSDEEIVIMLESCDLVVLQWSQWSWALTCQMKWEKGADRTSLKRNKYER